MLNKEPNWISWDLIKSSLAMNPESLLPRASCQHLKTSGGQNRPGNEPRDPRLHRVQPQM